MKFPITCLLILSMSIPYQQALASDPMDSAVDAVNESMKVMSAKALNQVEVDFRAALAQSLEEFYNQPGVQDVHAKLLTEQKALLNMFEGIERLDPTQVSNVQEKVNEAFQRYRDAVRKRYDASYLIADHNARARESLLFARKALVSFERTCASGSGVGGLGAEGFSYPSLPPPSYSVSVGFGTDTGWTGGAEYTGTGSQAEKNRNSVVGATWTATSITSSIALSGSAGSAVAACAAAAPYLGAAAVVVTLASLYMSAQERMKAENKIVEAKIYGFSRMATDADAAIYYKEHCQSLKSQTSKIVETLDLALSNPEELRKRVSAIPHIDQEIQEFQKLLEKRKALLEQVQQAQTPIEQKKRLLRDLAKIDRQIQAKSTPEQTSNMMLNFLVNRQDELEQGAQTLNWQVIDLAQRRAFQQLTKILTLLQRKSFAKFFNGQDEIGKEFAALDQYLETRKSMQQTLTDQVRAIFGRVSEEDLRARENVLRLQIQKLVKAYGHNPQVINLARQVKALLGEI